jgi:putative flippase GtrA
MAPSLIRRIPWLEMIRFAIMGLASTGIYLVIMAVLKWGMSMLAMSVKLWLLAMVAYLLSMAANYVLQRRVTFRSQRRHREAISRFLAVQLIGMALNSGLLELAVMHLRMSFWLAQFIVCAIVAVWSYGAQKFWVFMKWGASAR